MLNITDTLCWSEQSLLKRLIGSPVLSCFSEASSVVCDEIMLMLLQTVDETIAEGTENYLMDVFIVLYMQEH